ncbi:MAG: hypothetical protein AAF903_10575 [Pseudomonadota bacterium]
MKNLAKTISATLITATVFSMPPAHASDGFHTQVGESLNFAQSNCGKMYRRAKRIARDQAQRHCRRSHGSGGRAIRNTSWQKGVCDRPAGKATGTFYYSCR